MFRAYLDFYERSIEPAAYEHAWSRFMDDEAIQARGAKLDGRLVGIAHFFTHPQPTPRISASSKTSSPPPDARGQGIGRALIKHLVEWARQHGCSRVYWQTKESNTLARRLYDQVATHAGFIVYQIDL